MTDDKALVRFNATRHGVLSRYTVLPWEDADESGVVQRHIHDRLRPAQFRDPLAGALRRGQTPRVRQVGRQRQDARAVEGVDHGANIGDRGR